MTIEIGGSALRAEVVDKVIKQTAAQTYKFKQACTIATTAAWKDYFYRETSAVLNPLVGGSTASASKLLPRGANFPQATPSWEKVMTAQEKYGIEDNIFWEDILTDDIDVQARVMFKLGQKIAKDVDDEIWDTLTESRTPVLINSFLIDEADGWNGTSGAIIDDLLHAAQLIAEDNYDTTSLMAFISPADRRYVSAYLASKGAQFPSIGEKIAENGYVGRVAGVDLVVSNSVTTSYALVCVPKICATWRAAVPLTTNTTVDPFKSVRIRVVEMGITQMTDPNALCLIKGTQGPY